MKGTIILVLILLAILYMNRTLATSPQSREYQLWLLEQQKEMELEQQKRYRRGEKLQPAEERFLRAVNELKKKEQER